MINYTLIGKSHKCPMWGITVHLSAKYRFFDDDNPYIAKYAYCTCPIIENLKLPIHKQNKEFGLFRFCRMEQQCLHSVEFKPQIDVRKDGYSQ